MYEYSRVNEREREQIELVANREVGQAKSSLKENLKAAYANHAATGRLRSGVTIRVAVRIMTETAKRGLERLVNQVRSISNDLDAFQFVKMGVTDILDACGAELPEVLRMASGDKGFSSVNGAAMGLYQNMRDEIETDLAISSYDFGAPSMATVATQDTIAEIPRKGGRPPADFWDAMWAAIAVSLFNGDLAPKSQADVERAMTDWIEANGHSAAVSTVRARARRLWDRLSATDA